MKLNEVKSNVYIFSLMLFFVSISVLGNVDLLVFNGFPIRKVTFVIFTLTLLTLNLNQKIDYRIIISFFIFIFFGLFFGLTVPMVNDVNVSSSVSNILPFSIPMLSCLIVTATCAHDNNLLQKKISLIIFFVGLLHFFCTFIFFFNAEIGNKIYVACYIFFNDINLSDSMTPDFENSFLTPRIQYGISVFLILYVYLKIKAVIVHGGKVNKILFIVSIFFVLTTQSRAMIFSSFLMLFLYFSYYILLSRIRCKALMVAFFVNNLILPSVIVFLIVYIEPFTYLGITRSSGEELRPLQLAALLDGFVNNFFFGIYVGGHVDLIRSVASPWIYELSVIAFFTQIGIFGCVFLLLALFLFGYSIIPRSITLPLKCNVNYKLNALASSAIFTFLLACNTNPYLNNFIGGFILMIFFVDYYFSFKATAI